MINNFKHTISRAFLISAFVCFCSPSLWQSAAAPLRRPSPTIDGTWKGESTCAGNRPACKNEVVVYRFEAIPGRPDVFLLLADKIIEGQRIPMYKLEFQYNESKGELSCEFTKRQTHGLWQYTVSTDAMEGTLILLPGKELGRRVKVKRVGPKEVPPAPNKDMYEG
jgi:hypothetical protein